MSIKGCSLEGQRRPEPGQTRLTRNPQLERAAALLLDSLKLESAPRSLGAGEGFWIHGSVRGRRTGILAYDPLSSNALALVSPIGRRPDPIRPSITTHPRQVACPLPSAEARPPDYAARLSSTPRPGKSDGSLEFSSNGPTMSIRGLSFNLGWSKACGGVTLVGRPALGRGCRRSVGSAAALPDAPNVLNQMRVG